MFTSWSESAAGLQEYSGLLSLHHTNNHAQVPANYLTLEQAFQQAQIKLTHVGSIPDIHSGFTYATRNELYTSGQVVTVDF
jgi:hypothetical protein